MGMREDIMAVRKDLEEVKEKSFAYELLQENNAKNKRIYNVCKMLVVIIILQLLVIVGLGCYTAYLISTTETTIKEEKETIEVDKDSGDNGNNNFINGNENEVNN